MTRLLTICPAALLNPPASAPEPIAISAIMTGPVPRPPVSAVTATVMMIETTMTRTKASAFCHHGLTASAAFLAFSAIAWRSLLSIASW
ncbi:MAG: hypothetical protein E6J91_13045 [Deltaproteobacteria bacterium]|nr:MAG: hypothetical protein E6J91_13045 [Deltaproteobacteria bacterium]